MEKLCYKSITELSEQVKMKKVSPVELVEICLERIEKLNPFLNAFITVTAEEALRQSRIAESEINNGKWRGPLHGIPVGVKDFFDTEGVRTTAAFVHFKNRIPQKDAVAVQKLKEAGAIIIGKTNMHELGMGTTSVNSYFGSVHNPWNTDYVAGGSSGGSAAAVSAGLCYATVDTDAVGSCRLPAACCGVTGFKGTYGLISGKGILEGERADEVILKLAHVAITTRCVGDTALLLNILADSEINKSKFKNDYRAALKGNKKYIVGIARNYAATQEVRDIFIKTTEEFKKSGYSTIDIDVPFELASFCIDTIEGDRDKIATALFKDIDVLLLPTTTDLTPTTKAAEKLGPQGVAADNTFFSNYFALPAISVPCGFDKNNLPLGLQVVGPAWGEGVVLDVSHTFQKITGSHLKRPEIE
ncbi:MAG: amidase [Bacteroidetes bacterium]|nr:amidase [Bacteroidota bacterium]